MTLGLAGYLLEYDPNNQVLNAGTQSIYSTQHILVSIASRPYGLLQGLKPHRTISLCNQKKRGRKEKEGALTRTIKPATAAGALLPCARNTYNFPAELSTYQVKLSIHRVAKIWITMYLSNEKTNN